MPFEVQQTKVYEQSAQAVYEAALKAAAGLEGKAENQAPDKGQFEVRFDKKILGNVLGDRTFMFVKVSPQGETGSTIAIEAYPLDPVGRKLQFGARKGVVSTVVTWFFAHLEHHLGIKKGG
jgi:hypothetical protein